MASYILKLSLDYISIIGNTDSVSTVTVLNSEDKGTAINTVSSKDVTIQNKEYF